MLNIMWTKFKDYKQSLPIIVGMTVLALVLIYVFGMGFEGAGKPKVAVADMDNSAVSHRFTEAFMELEGFSYEWVDLKAGLEKVSNSDVTALVVIEEGFGDGILSGQSNVTLYRTGSSMEHVTLETNIQSLAALFVVDEGFLARTPGILGSIGIEVTESELADELRLQVANYPVLMVNATTYDGTVAAGYDSLKHSFIGYLLFFSMFTMVFGIGSIVEEKENRVWQRLTVSPIGAVQILAANMAVTYVVSMIQLTLMIVISRYAFGIDWGGSFLAIFLVLSIYVLAVTSLGLLLAGLVSTQQQLGSFSPVVIVSTSMLGGCMWPLEIITSKVLLFLADLTPQRWAYKGLKAVIVGGGGVADVTDSLLILTVITLILFAAAMVPYMRKMKTAS